MQKSTSLIFALLLLPGSILLAACSQPAATPATPTLEVINAATNQPTAEPTLELVPTPEPTALSSGDTCVSDIDGMEQIYIGAGDFIMGADDYEAKQSDANVNGVAAPEVPVHTVYVDAFWIDKYEVTNHQYSLCVADGMCTEPKLLNSFLGIPYYGNPEYDDYPVNYVDYYSARNYCTWAERRLPTEREWEKAARGIDARKYPWGNDPVTDDKANFCDSNCPKRHANPSYDDGYVETAPVGSYPAGASPYGVLDMAGNVWEWVDSVPMNYPYDPEDGREVEDPRTASCYLDSNCPENTTHFGDGPQRVWRGGTWANGLWWLRATVRYHSVPSYYHNSLGFRCAANPGTQ